MLGFVGQFQHSLDAKGRLILPAKFRPEFERGGHLSPQHRRVCRALDAGRILAPDRRAAAASRAGRRAPRANRFATGPPTPQTSNSTSRDVSRCLPRSVTTANSRATS